MMCAILVAANIRRYVSIWVWMFMCMHVCMYVCMILSMYITVDVSLVSKCIKCTSTVEIFAHVHAMKNKIWHINCTLRRVHINHHERVQGYTSYEHVLTPLNIIVAHSHINIQVGKCWHRLMIIYMPQKCFLTHQLHSTQIAYWSSWTCANIYIIWACTYTFKFHRNVCTYYHSCMRMLT